MMQHNQIYEQLMPGRLFARCAFPSMVSMAVTSLYTVADGIFVGRMIGADALAAINLVMPLIIMSFALADMVAAGSSVQISIRLGERREGEACRIFSFCSLLIVAISCAAGAGGLLMAEPLVRLMGAGGAVAELAVAYLRVYALFSPAIMIFFALDNYLRICGLVRYSMMLNVLTSVLNILLDFWLLVVLRRGIAAAALASCLSLALGTLLGLLPFLMRRDLPLRFQHGRLPLRMVASILANGSSEFFSNISGSVLMIILNTVLLRLSGSLAVAAFSIVMYVDSVVKSLLFGMADSLQPALSYNYGAGNSKRILALERWVLGAAALLSAATMLWMLLGGEQILALFVRTSDPALLAMSIRAMRLFSLSYLFSWAGIALSSFFTALNRPVFSLVMAFCQTLAFPLFCLTLLSSLLGLDGVWLTAAAAGALSTLLAAALLLFVLRGLRRQESPRQ